MRASPLVAYVEQDGLISLDVDVDLVDMEVIAPSSLSTQVSIGQVDHSNPLYSWGLDRIVSNTQHSEYHGTPCNRSAASMSSLAHCSA